MPLRYAAGKKQLQETFDVEVVETKHALKPNDWIYKNPEARANDLMEALLDPNIKAIISTIGGDESIRTLPYIDLDIIKNNPKIFLGYSDTTVTHFCFYKAGVTSFYGTSLMVGFAENNGMHNYQITDILRSLFSEKPVGLISPNMNGWTSELLPWADPKNQSIPRKLEPSLGWRWLQGKGKIQGELLGGCVEVLLSTIREEEGLVDLPIITGMDFGHTCPTFTLPLGIQAEIDCEEQTFFIIENALENKE